MERRIEELARYIEQPADVILEAKNRSSRPAVGCFPMYVPHELVHAAGVLPVDIYGGTGEMTVASTYLQTIACYPLRSAFEQLLTGELSYLDGAILATVCTGATSGGGMWRSLAPFPFYHQLVIPRTLDSSTEHYFRRQIARLRTHLETFAGKPIPDAALSASISLYNRSRLLLARLGAISRQVPDVLPARDFLLLGGPAAFCFATRTWTSWSGS